MNTGTAPRVAGTAAATCLAERLPHPDRGSWTAHVVRASWYSLCLTALFALVYGTGDTIARFHQHRVTLMLPADRAIPFVPEATVIYSSLYAMFALVPFALHTNAELRSLTRVIALEILIAGTCFLVLPMDARAVPSDLGRFATAFRVADWINLDHNLFPSLHATFAFTTAAVLSRRCGVAVRVALGTWAFAIALAALLTWQHIIVDIAGALLLTWSVLRYDVRSRLSMIEAGR